MGAVPEVFRRFLFAVGTLSVVRMPVHGEVSGDELRASTGLYPLAGVAVGVFPAALLLLPLPPLPRAALALAAWVIVTGAFHLDGWADCCDAAFAPAREDPAATRERRLAILKDPNVGTFGVAGVGLLLLGKWTALVHVPWFAPLLAAPVARWSMVQALRAHPPARPTGLGATFAGRVPLGTATLVLAAVVLALLGVFLPLPLWGWGVGAALAGAAVGAGVATLFARRFGGVTGDVCGASGEAAELAVLWALLPWGA